MKSKFKLSCYQSFRQLMVIAVLFLFSLPVLAQGTQIRGKVIDNKNETVIGAIVVVKGTSNGTTTDIDGTFTLNNININTDILEISSIGYHKQEIPLKGRSNINIVLQEDIKLLDEVVVIGYGQVRKGDATGAISSVKADASTRGFAPNAQDMLTGKIAGVNITTGNGAPTTGSTIRIRGGSSLSASNDPLIVIDGVPIDNSGIGGVGNILSTINPTDIETFTVLKDASSTAIYGSRASNGVIMITTKKGAAGTVKITYDGNVSYNIPKKKIEVLTGDEFREFVHNTFRGAGNYNEVISKLGTANTDWQSEIFEASFNTEHNLSILGTFGNSMPYRISGAYTNINGILKTSDMERFTGSFSLNPSLFDKHLNMSLNGKAMRIKNRFASTSAIGAAISMDPTKPVRDEYSPFGFYYTWIGDDGNILDVATKNPVSLLTMKDDRSKATNFIGNAQFDYKLHFLPELNFNMNLGIDYSESEGSIYIPENAPSDFLYGGFDSGWNQTRRNSLFDFYTQYKNDFGFLDSKFDIMGGYSWQHYWRKGDNMNHRISKFDSEGNPLLIEKNNYETENYIISFFGRLNYSILDKYLLTFTLRNDGSSRFHPDNRWSLFPSVGLAWRMSEESFMKNIEVISDAKLRLGWGVTGQQDINAGDYPYMGRYEYSIGDQASYIRGYDENGQPIWVTVMRPSAYNKDLKWESTTTWNAGMDYGFWGNRLYGSLDFYHRKTTDLINAEARIAAGTNFSEFVAANIGSLENTGFEFSVVAVPIAQKELTWSAGFNFAYNKNKITKLSYGDNESTMRRYGSTGGDGSFQLLVHSVGNPAGMFYVYEQLYDENGKPIEGLYVDRNKDNRLTEEDLRPYKKPTPDWTFGLNTKLEWRHWDFAIAGHGSLGNYNYNGMAANSAELSPGRVFANEFLSNRTNSAFETNFQTKKVLSDYYIQDASFFRIDNITVGWSFTKSKILPLSGRIYSSIQNSLVFTKYKGLDPEVFGGVDNDFYPRPLTVMLGVNLNF